MRKITLFMLMLTMFVGVAKADFTQYISDVTASTTYGNADSSTYPTGLSTVIANHECDGTVKVYTIPVNVPEDGNVVVDFDYTSGYHRLVILGVDLLNADGTVAAGDYHYASTGGSDTDRTFTVSNVAAGNYTLRYYFCHKAADHEVGNQSATITITGADKEASIDITYIYKYGEYTISTVTVEGFVGKSFPAANPPAGFTASTPDGTVTAGTSEKEIECTIELPSTQQSETTANYLSQSFTDAPSPWNAVHDDFVPEGVKTAQNANGEKGSNPVIYWAHTGINVSTGNVTVKFQYTVGNARLDVLGVDLLDPSTLDVVAADYDFSFTGSAGATKDYTLSVTTAGQYIMRYFVNHGGNSLMATNGSITVGYTYATPIQQLIAELQATVDAANAINWGTTVGTYNKTDIIQQYLTEAQLLIDLGSESAEDITAANANLAAAIASPEMNMPKEGVVYTLRCDYLDRILHAGSDANLYFAPDTYDKNNSLSAWVFEAGETEGTFKMKSLHTNLYIPTLASDVRIVMTEAGADVTISASTAAEGAVMFTTSNNGIGIHAHRYEVTDNSPVIGYTNEASANHYYVEEAEAPTYTLTVGETGYATMCLGFNALLPEIEGDGNGVFVVSSVQNWAVLTQVDETILPAGTSVIVKAAAGTELSFVYTADAAADNFDKGVLEGTTVDTYIAGAAYVLGNVDGTIGLYSAKLNKDAAGADVADNGDGTAAGTHFLNNANKAYLPAPADSTIEFFGFGFEGTTGIENVEVAKTVDAIYDLTGRRVEAITEAGIYIVGGKKVLVK